MGVRFQHVHLGDTDTVHSGWHGGMRCPSTGHPTWASLGRLWEAAKAPEIGASVESSPVQAAERRK